MWYIIYAHKHNSKSFQAKSKQAEWLNLGRDITIGKLFYGRPEQDRLRDRAGERERERERPMRLCGSEVGCVSYPESRMNHSSQQSRAIRYVRQQENCPFALKENLCSRDQSSKRYPLARQVPTPNEFTNRKGTTQRDYSSGGKYHFSF